MNGQHQDQINELHGVVAVLVETLAASERRTARLQRAIRWGTTGAVAVLGLTLLFSVNLLGSAIAQPDLGGDQGQPNTVVDALNRINENLGGLGMMTQMMEVAVQGAIHRAMEEQNENYRKRQEKQHNRRTSVAESPLGNYVEEFTNRQCAMLALPGSDHAPPDETVSQQVMPMDQFCPLYKNKYLKALPVKAGDQFPIGGDQQMPFRMRLGMLYQQAIMEATGNILVDAGVLMYRVREDSDLFRRVVDNMGGPNKLLEGIKGELHVMNGMLSSIPVMTAQMDAMTRQMGAMSHSVGSTMGRAGSWMPW